MRCKSKTIAFISAAVLLVIFTAGAVANTVSGTGDAQSAAIRAAEAWVFPQNPLSQSPSTPQVMLKALHVPGSARTYTLAQITVFNPPDWWPQEHPPMPQIVAHGHKPAWACALCHLPNGQGRPENAALAGLPAAYIIEQIKAFRDDERGSDRLRTMKYMQAEARNVSDADLKSAADYFSSLHFKKWTKVIETASVSRTQFQGFLLVPIKGAGDEPIGNRIIEVAQDEKLSELRDARSGFIAYVPRGSIERGAVIAAKGIGAAPACEFCHGADLQGVGNIPPLVGRSPTYIVRELILFQTGKRANPGAAPMRLEVSYLTVPEMIDVAAYAASRKP